MTHIIILAGNNRADTENTNNGVFCECTRMLAI